MKFVKTHKITVGQIHGTPDYKRRVYFVLPREANYNYYYHNLRMVCSNPENLVDNINVSINQTQVCTFEKPFNPLFEGYFLFNGNRYVSVAYNEIKCTILFKSEDDTNKGFNFGTTEFMIDVYEDDGTTEDVYRIKGPSFVLPDLYIVKECINNTFASDEGVILNSGDEINYTFDNDVPIRNIKLKMYDLTYPLITYDNNRLEYSNGLSINFDVLKEVFPKFDFDIVGGVGLTVLFEFTKSVNTTFTSCITRYVNHKLHSKSMLSTLNTVCDRIRVKNHVTGDVTYNLNPTYSLGAYVKSLFKDIPFRENMDDCETGFNAVLGQYYGKVIVDIFNYPQEQKLYTFEAA